MRNCRGLALLNGADTVTVDIDGTRVRGSEDDLTCSGTIAQSIFRAKGHDQSLEGRKDFTWPP